MLLAKGDTAAPFPVSGLRHRFESLRWAGQGPPVERSHDAGTDNETKLQEQNTILTYNV